MGVKEIKQVLQLQATIDKPESKLEISTQEISKYRILWKNECRAADADRYGEGVSQTSQSSLSPHCVYCESYNLHNFIEGIILLVKTQSHTFFQDLYIEKF